MRFPDLLRFAALLLAGTLGTVACALPRYSVTDLTIFGIPWANDINDSGHIVGGTVDGEIVVWDGSQVRNLGKGGFYEVGGLCIGPDGTVVGSVQTTIDNLNRHALRVRDGVFTDLGGLPGFRESLAYSINGRGWIVGRSTGGGDTRGFILKESGWTDLGHLGGFINVEALDINESGQVCGWSEYEMGGYSHAFLWQNGQMRDLGDLGGKLSLANEINDAGMVVGWAELAGSPIPRHAFIYSAGRMIDMGVLGEGRRSEAACINDWAVVCGFTHTTTAGGIRAFVWRGGVMRLLPDLVEFGGSGVLAISNPTAINIRGQILVDSLTAAGAPRALLTPLAPTGEPTRLVNVSVRAGTRVGEGTSIAGFVLSGGTAPGSVLVRVAGPALDRFDVAGAADDPRLDLYRQGVRDPIDGNDNWSAVADPAPVAEAAQRVHAFAFASGSADAALLASLAPAAYTVHATAASEAGGGVALSEVYDASTEATAARLTNASMRVWVGGGEETAIVGFVLQGENPARVLIRAVGPGLAPHGVAQRLADPMLFLHREGRPVFGNDNWGTRTGFPLLAQVSDTAGAFGLADGSADAALIAELEPGSYTVHVNGADGGSGVALVEVYLLPMP